MKRAIKIGGPEDKQWIEITDYLPQPNQGDYIAVHSTFGVFFRHSSYNSKDVWARLTQAYSPVDRSSLPPEAP